MTRKPNNGPTFTKSPAKTPRPKARSPERAEAANFVAGIDADRSRTALKKMKADPVGFVNEYRNSK